MKTTHKLLKLQGLTQVVSPCLFISCDSPQKRANGVEPSTFSLEGYEQESVSTENNGLTDAESGACTNACTNLEDQGGKPANSSKIDLLAEAITNLSESDRQALIAKLADRGAS